jgi:CRISPR/Cas system-associated protein Cas5 (RAMP superfamily)
MHAKRSRNARGVGDVRLWVRVKERAREKERGRERERETERERERERERASDPEKKSFKSYDKQAELKRSNEERVLSLCLPSY